MQHERCRKGLLSFTVMAFILLIHKFFTQRKDLRYTWSLAYWLVNAFVVHFRIKFILKGVYFRKILCRMRKFVSFK